MDYTIKHAKTEQELDDALAFAREIFGEHIGLGNRDEWLERMERNNDLLLYAESNNEVAGIVFGYIENNGNMTASIVALDKRLRNRGVAREMILLLKERATARGVHLIALGSVQTAESFYAKLGYTGSLLIQSETRGIDEMLSLNTRYEARYTNVYDSKINQVCLALPEVDRELKSKVIRSGTGCENIKSQGLHQKLGYYQYRFEYEKVLREDMQNG